MSLRRARGTEDLARGRGARVATLPTQPCLHRFGCTLAKHGKPHSPAASSSTAARATNITRVNIVLQEAGRAGAVKEEMTRDELINEQIRVKCALTGRGSCCGFFSCCTACAAGS